MENDVTSADDGEARAPEPGSFRADVRRWLAARLPPRRDEEGTAPLEFMGVGEGLDALPRARRYLATLAERGWGAPGWPKKYGGAGLSSGDILILTEELRAFETPDLYMFSVGLRHAGAAILEHGSEEQKVAWLPRIATGEDIWCQIFSEPGAGSDLAGLATRAAREPGGWRLSGQKVWVSRAHAATWGIILARTDPIVPKHRGITAFVLDMSAEGIDVRPLKQINGDEHFNEIFLDSVWIPDTHRLGQVGNGWRVAVSMLAGERTQTGGAGAAFGDDHALISRLIELVRHSNADHDLVVRQELAEVIIQARLAERTSARAVAAAMAGKSVGAEGSGDKLRKAATLKRAAALALSILGPAGATDGEWQNLFLSAPSMSIRGGTDEILLNVIGERVLGLPPEPRVDKEIPFSEVPR
ncbi:acyl-CoA dehydrogenase [soil metagenome]